MSLAESPESPESPEIPVAVPGAPPGAGPGAAPGEMPVPAPTAHQLVGLRWERIQLHLRLRPGPDPESLRLVPLDGGPEMVPTWAARQPDGDLAARFNVMTGPGQRPLTTGRWQVAAVDPAEPRRPPAPVQLAPAAGVELEAARAAFVTRRGEYRVRPVLDGRSLVLEVELDPRVSLPPDPLRVRKPLHLRLLRKARTILFKLAYEVARRTARRTGRRILFLSHYGTELSGDMQAILARLRERGLDRRYRLDAIPPVGGRSLPDRLRLPWLLGRADTIVIDAHIPDANHLVPLTARILQLWHAAGSIKTIGYSRIGKPHGPDPWDRTYKDSAYAIVAGEHDVPLFAEAFGIPEDRVIPTGHPRMDRFFDPAWREQARETALAQFPEARGRKVILFAPTWRQSPGGRVYDLSILDYARLHELCVEKDAVFIIRLHPTVREPFEIPAAYRDRILNGQSAVMDAPDLLCATDLLITDYSSIVLEYSLLGRPMLFFAHDLEAYKADRDVYLPYEEFVPGRIVTTFDELVGAIRTEDYGAEAVPAFAARHFAHFDTGATDRVIELIIGGSPPDATGAGRRP